jgi:hypothetical protein
MKYIHEACNNPKEIKGGTYIWIDEISSVQAEIHKLKLANPKLDFSLLYEKLEEVVNEFFRKAVPVLETRKLMSELTIDKLN